MSYYRQPQTPAEWLAWEKFTAPHPCATIARCSGCGRGYITLREGARCLACDASIVALPEPVNGPEFAPSSLSSPVAEG